MHLPYVPLCLSKLRIFGSNSCVLYAYNVTHNGTRQNRLLFEVKCYSWCSLDDDVRFSKSYEITLKYSNSLGMKRDWTIISEWTQRKLQQKSHLRWISKKTLSFLLPIVIILQLWLSSNQHKNSGANVEKNA